MARLSAWVTVGPMAYPASFHRLVLIGDIYTDVFNTTLAMVPVSGSLPAVTDALLEDVATEVGTWFQLLAAQTGNQIQSIARLTSVKLNRINAAGLYQDAETKEHVYPAPLAGTGSSRSAPQLSLVVTLRGANERALAGRGRMYLPPVDPIGSLQTDGRVSSGQALANAQGVATLIAGLNDVYLTAGVNAVAGIASRTGAGAFQTIEKISSGRVVDTMRSRRNKLDEAPEYAVF